MTNVTFGKIGEDLACQFLKKQGYKIIERNFRIRGGEIDIVAQDGQTLVYIEVKSRSTYQFGRPEEAVNRWKLRFLERAAKFYRANRKNLNLPLLERIDVVTVDLTNSNPKLSIIKNAGF